MKRWPKSRHQSVVPAGLELPCRRNRAAPNSLDTGLGPGSEGVKETRCDEGPVDRSHVPTEGSGLCEVGLDLGLDLAGGFPGHLSRLIQVYTGGTSTRGTSPQARTRLK